MRWLVNLMITSLIFFPEKQFYEMPSSYGLKAEDVFLTTSDAVKIHGWFLPAAEEKATILFFHGNAGNISGRLFKAKGWVERGFSVLMVDYRGYGKSEGKIESQEDLLKDAQAAWDYLIKIRKKNPPRIILYGESLGTHPAIRLGCSESAAAVILEAPFTSFVDLAGIHYPFFPKGLVSDFSFPNEEWIGRLKTPLFILHGTADEICPFSQAEKLYEKARGQKDFFRIEGGTHNDLPMSGGEDYWDRPYEFVNRILAGSEKA